MKYLFIDKILKVVLNKELAAIKCTCIAEDYFSEHFPGFPVMPGTLQIEAIAQAATALIEISCDYKYKAILLMVEKAKFRKIIKPGQQLFINVEIISQNEDSIFVEGTITSEEKRVMECNIIMGRADRNIFYPLKTRHLIEAMYDSWLQNTEIIK